MKKHFKSISLGILVLSLCLSLIACTVPQKTPSGTTVGTTAGTAPTPTPTASTFVGIDINPSLELTLDENKTVISVCGANEDGKVLLYGEETKLLGKHVDEAVAYLTELAIELGYLSEENPDVSTTVASADQAAAEALKEQIDAKLTATAEGLGLSVTVDVETAFSLLCQLEELRELYPDNTAIQTLTPERYRLVVAATEDGKLSVTAAAELTDAQLIAEINRVHATLEGYATDAYLAAKARATALFESSMGVLLDGVYTEVYTARLPSILSNPSYLNTIHYGAMYQAYKTSARTYLSVLEIMTFADEYTNFVPDEATVEAIATELGISDTSALEDEEGNVTLGSILAFCDDHVNGLALNEASRTALEGYLADAKAAAELTVMASDAYAADLAALKTSIDATVTAVSTVSSAILPMLPSAAKAEFEACLADLDEARDTIVAMMENGATRAEILPLAAKAQEKADAVLARIEADLTDAEKETVDAKIAAINASIATLTAEFEARLDTAEAAAKQYLQAERARRLGTAS